MKVRVLWVIVAGALGVSVPAQTREYPKEIRGYKVERTAVELRGSTNQPKTTSSRTPATTDQNPPPVVPPAPQTSSSPVAPPPDDVDQLITFGRPSVARVTPLGISLHVPVVVAPIKQSGHVDFLLFEDMTVNEHSVEIDEYHRGFNLPTKKPLTLHEPLQFYIYLPVAALAAIDEWSNSKDTWPVSGRVYVCGKYRKFLFSFKRCVPVELDLTMRNPLKG